MQINRDYDLIIRGGTIVDGSGNASYIADIGIRDGIICEVGNIEQSSKVEVDAAGCVVTPGFVDVHTHYDGQAIWSDRLNPSSQHGVTTVVAGNCGVGFAPCRQEDHDALMNVMEGVEDIPNAVMSAGLTWNWETFPQYLDALDEQPRDIDVAVYLPHSPLRVYVMGDRGVRREVATKDDLDHIKKIVGEALDAGALGFATSRLSVHRTGTGENIPSYNTDHEELLAIASVFKEKGKGIFQAVPAVDEDVIDVELSFLENLSSHSGRPVTFSLLQRNSNPDGWRKIMARIDKANRQEDINISAQVFPRPVGIILGFGTTVNPFSMCPSYAQVADLSLTDRIRKLKDPSFREKLLEEEAEDPMMPLFKIARDFPRIFLLNSAKDYEPLAHLSIAERAKRQNKSCEEVAYDLLLENDGTTLLYAALANYAQGSLDPVLEMMRDPNAIIGLGDGGAHYGMICDASFPTFVITHWTRDRDGEKISLEEAIHLLTCKPAWRIGLKDRGLLKVGYKADLNIIDYNNLELAIPHVVHDLPGGGRRFMQDAKGYKATIVNGVIIQRDGVATGALPGHLVRGEQQPRPAYNN